MNNQESSEPVGDGGADSGSSDVSRSIWRVDRKVPINVYEDDRPVCQCHTAEDASRIVQAMNGELWRRLEEVKAKNARLRAGIANG